VQGIGSLRKVLELSHLLKIFELLPFDNDHSNPLHFCIELMKIINWKLSVVKSKINIQKISSLENEVAAIDFLTKDQPAYRKTIFALFTGSFISFMILYSVQTLIPIFSEEFAVSPATSSLTLSVTTGFLAVMMFFGSILSDSFGRKRIMTISLFISSILCIAASFSPNFSTLMIIRAMQGIALAGFPSIAMTYVSEEFHPKHLGIVMGIYVSGTSIGGLSGRIVTAALTEWFSWQTALLMIGFFSFCLSIWFWKALPQPKHSPINKRVSLLPAFLHIGKDVRLLCLFGLPFLLMGSFVTVYNYLGFLLMSSPHFLSQTVIGLIFFVYLVGTFSSTLMGRVSDLFGKPKIVSVCIILMLAGVSLTLSTKLMIILVGLSIFTFGFFGSHSIASNWVGELSRSHRAQAASFYLLAYYLGSSIVGTSGGTIWSHFGWEGVITMVTLLIGSALLLVTMIVYLTRRAEKPSAAHSDLALKKRKALAQHPSG
jgi:YNFM family putative membrane transporter